LEELAEFGSWQDAEEGELRSEVAWPDDPERRADLALLFVHLPG
jgi:hypothetical protein